MSIEKIQACFQLLRCPLLALQLKTPTTDTSSTVLQQQPLFFQNLLSPDLLLHRIIQLL